MKKVLDRKELGKVCRRLKAEGRKIVFTNGCFDILHPGHVRYLEAARTLGDLLVVAVNSDSSVRGLKGDTRPINNEQDRAEVLAGLAAVDYVIIFSEPDPYRVIKELLPDVLVKGGDWPVDKIIGGDIVKSRGGKVVNVPFVEGSSTTGTIDRILQKHK